MADYDALHERGRSLEEEYFRRKNRELIEKLQRDARENLGSSAQRAIANRSLTSAGPTSAQ